MAIVKFARGSKGNLTTNLRIEEFQCKCGKCSATVHDEALSVGLQKIRSHFGKKLIITSGYRCPSHNANTPGASSQSVPSQYGSHVGYPSNIYENLGRLRGYTEVGAVHLEGINCTEHEREEIMSLLQGGVIL